MGRKISAQKMMEEMDDHDQNIQSHNDDGDSRGRWEDFESSSECSSRNRT